MTNGKRPTPEQIIERRVGRPRPGTLDIVTELRAYGYRIVHPEDESGIDDELLSVLVAQADIESVETWSDPGGCSVKLWYSFQSWPDQHHAPTLHAALQAAVKALAESGS